MIRYKDYTVEILKQMLRKRGLKVSGRKAELVQRLEEDDKTSGNIPEGNSIDHRGPDDIPNENTGSSPTGKEPVAMKDLGIHVEHYSSEDSGRYSNSEMVQQLFKLVRDSKNIRARMFGRRLRGKDTQCDSENKAERSYDLNLRKRASELARNCNETKMCDAFEAEWIQLLSPRVFRPFIRSEDDNGYGGAQAHYW